MALVSFIFPAEPGTLPTGERIEPFRQILADHGHTVEVLVVSGQREGVQEGSQGPVRVLDVEEPGLAVAAVAGLREARGDLLVVLDLERGYVPEDVAAVLVPLAEGDADLVVASRSHCARPWVAWAGTLARPLLGTSDPLSGMIAMTREALREVDNALAPIGSRFALEFLVKVKGKRIEIPVRMDDPDQPGRIVLSDLRHVKRLADDRFGNISRLVQFCLVGASGMVVDLSCYALFQWIFSRTPLAGMRTPVIGGSLALATAGALAIALALVWNFSLNRRLTFSYARHGSLIGQFVTYALGNALGIALSFTLRLLLPMHVGFFQQHKLAAALVGIIVATGISFSMSRWVVFNRRSVERDRRNAAAAFAEHSPAP
jgi:dolichol-phosphate mannosyltransferase